MPVLTTQQPTGQPVSLVDPAAFFWMKLKSDAQKKKVLENFGKKCSALLEEMVADGLRQLDLKDSTGEQALIDFHNRSPEVWEMWRQLFPRKWKEQMDRWQNLIEHYGDRADEIVAQGNARQQYSAMGGSEMQAPMPQATSGLTAETAAVAPPPTGGPPA